MGVKAMNLTLPIPDRLADQHRSGGDDLARRALEGFALEEYKAGRVSRSELREWLCFETGYELDAFLKAHAVWADVSIEDLRRDVHDLESLGL
jgi:hypothetical protein